MATELMLEKVTRNPGEFNESFVKEFKIFTEELRDFFSAGSLTFMLEAVQPVLEEADRSSFQRFHEAKDKLDKAGNSADMNVVMDVLHKLTTVCSVNKISKPSEPLFEHFDPENVLFTFRSCDQYICLSFLTGWIALFHEGYLDRWYLRAESKNALAYDSRS